LKKVLRKKGQKSIHQLTIEQQEPTLSPDLMEDVNLKGAFEFAAIIAVPCPPNVPRN
jgi:hypothetical protein